MKKLIVLLFCTCSLFLLIDFVHAGVYDPKLKYRSLQTEHFVINYPENIETVARRTAVICEEVYDTLTPKYDWKPWGRTEVTLTDQTDVANGMATVLPYNWMILRVTAPGTDEVLSNYDDWLRLLIMHEFVHILTMDQHKGFWTPFRYILGKTAVPNGMDPGWIKEGIAVYEESDETRAGRGRGSYAEMMLRTAILQNKFLHIDQADGDQWKWPNGDARYIYGGKFLEYLAANHGGEKNLYEFFHRVSGSPLVGAINRQARQVFSDPQFQTRKVHNRFVKEKKDGAPRSKTFYGLWNEWKAVLEIKYAAQKAMLEKEGLTEIQTVSMPKKANIMSPVLSPDGQTLAFVEFSPYGPSKIVQTDLDGLNRKVLVKNAHASQIAFTPDGKSIIYSKRGAFKTYYYVYDLWQYDFETKKAKQLTKGQRAKDPSVSQDGKEIVCVTQDAGTATLSIYDIEKSDLTSIKNEFPLYTQFANPQFSPDGKKIAVSVAVPGSVWDIYIFSREGKLLQKVTDDLALDSHAAWDKSGKKLYYISDLSGISNLYRFDIAVKKNERVTNVLTGIFEPVIDEAGEFAFVQYYNGKGYDLRKFTIPGGGKGHVKAEPRMGLKSVDGIMSKGLTVIPAKAGIQQTASWDSRFRGNDTQGPKPLHGLSGLSEEETVPAVLEDPSVYKSKKYSPFGKGLLLPRFVSPYFEVLGDAAMFSVATGAADPLRWHNWLGGGTYRTDAKYFGYFWNYWYNRFKPILDMGVMNYAAEFGYIRFNIVAPSGAVISNRTVHFFEKRLRGYGGIAYPFGSSVVSLKYFYEDREPLTKLTAAEASLLNEGAFAGFNLFYGFNDSKQYAASISREGGRRVKMSMAVTNKVLGSAEKNEQYVYAGDWREYIKTFHRQVLALRASGGITWGDTFVQGTFAMGGAMGEGVLAGQGSLYYFPLRGLPMASFSAERAMLLSAEYRFPLLSVQRGIGTLPVFLNDAHIAVFADYGNIWQPNAKVGSYFFNNFMLGTGLELRGDFVLGYGLPVTGRLGYGILVINNDRAAGLTDPVLGSPAKDGIFILQLGTSF